MSGKLLGDTCAFFIMGAEEAFDMLAVGGTSLADIHSDIKDGTLYTADQLRLSEWRSLEVQTTHHTV